MENIFDGVWPEWVAEKQIGRGSFGAVYRALKVEAGIESRSAIKVINIPQDDTEIDSMHMDGMTSAEATVYLQNIVNDFVREIQVMESLKGMQNIVSIEDFKVIKLADSPGWRIYIRMELLTPFSAYISGKPLTESDIIRLGCEICSALEICQSRNIIHRDIKPENIFVNDFGFFKLGDFGIARKLENLTSGMSQKGTMSYMAPEVAHGTHYDHRADICSLGLVLYRLLNNGCPPFMTERSQLLSPEARMKAREMRLSGEPLPAPLHGSQALKKAVMCACAYRPEDRFPTASAMKAALMSVKGIASGDRYTQPNDTPSWTVPGSMSVKASSPIQSASAPAPVQQQPNAPAPVQHQPSAPIPVQQPASAPVPVQQPASAPVQQQPSAPAPVPLQPVNAPAQTAAKKRFPWAAVVIPAAISVAAVIVLVIVLINNKPPQDDIIDSVSSYTEEVSHSEEQTADAPEKPNAPESTPEPVTSSEPPGTSANGGAYPGLTLPDDIDIDIGDLLGEYSFLYGDKLEKLCFYGDDYYEKIAVGENTGGKVYVQSNSADADGNAFTLNFTDGSSKKYRTGTSTDFTVLKYMGDLSSLTTLTARYNRVNDTSGLKLCSGSLTSLDLGYNMISDLSDIAECKKLTYLDLSSNPVSDITPLEDLKSLEVLDLTDTNVSAEDVSYLQKVLPGCTIYY